MALIEIEDAIAAELAKNGIKYTDASGNYGKARESQAALEKLLAGPHRTEILKAYKVAYPNVPIPELDAAVPINEAVGKISKEFEDFKASIQKEKDDAEAKRREEAANTTVAAGRKWLRANQKLDDDGVTAVEKVMQDLGIPNYQVAFNHWRAEQPAQPEQLPSSWGNRSLDWFQEEKDKPDTTMLLKDPLAFRRQAIGQVMRDARDGKLAAA